MFADSLLDSHWPNRSQRGWTTLASFAVQGLCVAAVLMLPLLYNQGLPKLHLVSLGAPLGPPPGRRSLTAHHPSTASTQPNISPSIIVAPPEVPRGIERGGTTPPPEDNGCPTCVPGGTGDIASGNVVPDSLGNTAPVVPAPPVPVAQSPRVSVMMEGNLIQKVQPAYPPLARAGRIQGPVVLRALISKTGTIEKVRVLSGPPLLVRAAVDAVSQWRYRPYRLNGEPLEVETQVTVNFILSGIN
jgi:periplasmic protein TonB